MGSIDGVSSIGFQGHFVPTPVHAVSFSPMPEALPVARLADPTRFARGIFDHRSVKNPGDSIPTLTAGALELFALSGAVPRWAAECQQYWPGFHPHIGPEMEVRDQRHDSSVRGIVHVTPTATLYEELQAAVPGSTIVTVPERPPFVLTGRSAKLFPGRGFACEFPDARYMVHVFGGTDDAMIRVSEYDQRTGRCRGVAWPLLQRESPFHTRRECCLAGLRQAAWVIASKRGIAPDEMIAAIDQHAATGIAYARDADGREMAFFEFADGRLTCTNGFIEGYPDGVSAASWDEAITWIERAIFSGNVVVSRDTNMTALSVPTGDGDVQFTIGHDGYGVPEIVPPGPIALSQWSAITQMAAGLEATGALGGTPEIPTALQAHVELPFQHADGTFTAAPLVSVLQQWRNELPLLEELIPAEPGRYVFIQNLHAAVFAALDAADLEDTSPLGVATVYGNLLAAFFVHHGAKYATFNISPICAYVLRRLSRASAEVCEWLSRPHPLLSGQSLADILPALKNQPTIEVRRSDTLVTETGAFSAWLNEAMLWFYFGWTLRAIAQAGR